MEVLEQRHPFFDSIFHYLPGGMALTALLALPIAELLSHRVTLLIGGYLLVLCIFLDGRALKIYFTQGRPDWRPLANFLRTRPEDEWIFTENPHAMLCTAFYADGPDWLLDPGVQRTHRVISLDGKPSTLEYAWRPGQAAWLVLAAAPKSEEIRRWAERFPSKSFPAAEDAVLKHLTH